MARGKNIDLWAVGVLMGAAVVGQWMGETASHVALLSRSLRPEAVDWHGRTSAQINDAILRSRDLMRDQCEQMRGNRLEIEHEVRELERQAREFERDVQRSLPGPVHIVWR